MSIELLETPVHTSDPLEIIESVAHALNYECERIDNDELHVVIAGAWRDVGIWFTWRRQLSTLQMGAPLDLKVPETKIQDANRLVNLVNERLWVGHYDFWSEDHTIVYRNASILPEDASVDKLQAELMLKATAEAVERFYPAFNFLIWGDKTPEDALRSSMFETAGNA